MSWAEYYRGIFGVDPEDSYYARMIPVLPVAPLRQHLEQILEVVNSESNGFSDDKWISFKNGLLKDGRSMNNGEPGDTVFLFTESGLELDWELLGPDPCKYFVVHTIIEGHWPVIHPCPPCIWDVIDANKPASCE